MSRKVRFLVSLVTASVLAVAQLAQVSAAPSPGRVPGPSKANLVTPQSAGTMSTGLVVSDTSIYSPDQLVQALLGPGVSYSNVQFHGAAAAAGYFNDGGDPGDDPIIGFHEGILLSSGNVVDVVGPNQTSGTTTEWGRPGDADLAALIPGYAVQDAAVLDFDFVPEDAFISFQYVFSSEEYNEYVGTQFNDVFGFFVNGTNVALLPVTGAPVAINNVNLGANHAYYRNNEGGGINTEMDGLTTVLTAQAQVVPNQPNHIKLAIADAGDYRLDSNVFIKAGSFISDDPPQWPVGAALTASDITSSSLILHWPEATDDLGVTGYLVYQDGAPIGGVSAPLPLGTDISFPVTGLVPATSYDFVVKAQDTSGKLSSDLAGTFTTLMACAPILNFISPSSNVPLEPFDIQFTYNPCGVDSTVAMRVRNAETGQVISGYTYGADITYDPATGIYTQHFDPNVFHVAPGTQLKIQVYFGGKLKGSTLVIVG